jgi:hypothetical protein
LNGTPTSYTTGDNIIHGTISIASAGVYSLCSVCQFSCATAGTLQRAFLFFDILNNAGFSQSQLGNTTMVGPTVNSGSGQFLYLSSNGVYSFDTSLTYPCSVNLRLSMTFATGAYNRTSGAFIFNIVRIA